MGGCTLDNTQQNRFINNLYLPAFSAIFLLMLSQQSYAYELITAKGMKNISTNKYQIVTNKNSKKIQTFSIRKCSGKNTYKAMIEKVSRELDVDARFVAAIINAESCFNVKAISPKGAQGLMQLMPFTAKRFGVLDSFDAEQNITGGVKYLKFLLARYDNNMRLAAAAYNAGEGAVDRYDGIPPYQETQNYVVTVLRVFNKKVAQDKQQEEIEIQKEQVFQTFFQQENIPSKKIKTSNKNKLLARIN